MNEVAKRNSVPRQAVDVIPLGDDYGLLGVGLQPMVSSEGELVVFLMASVCKTSTLVPIRDVAQIAIAGLCKFPVDKLKELYERAVNPPKEPDAQ